MRATLLALALLLLAPVASAADVAPPRPEGRVTDPAHVLSFGDRGRIDAALARYEQETSHQIAVLLVPTLSGESVEEFSSRVFKAWELGQKGLDNGILVTLAMQEKRVRIELGPGMGRYISSATAQRIIDELMIPAFKKGDFAGGLQAGLEQLMLEGRKFVVKPADVQR